MLIVLALYAALCLLLLGIAVKLVLVAFRPATATPDGIGQSPDVTSESPQPASTPERPRQRRTISQGTSGRSNRDDLVERLERQFHNSPSLSSNPEE